MVIITIDTVFLAKTPLKQLRRRIAISKIIEGPPYSLLKPAYLKAMIPFERSTAR